MAWIKLRNRRARMTTVLFLVLVVVGGPTACGDPLEVSDPTAILETDLNNAEGAELLRRRALRGFYAAVGEAALLSGLLSDEFVNQPTASQELLGSPSPNQALDRRETAEHVRLYDGSTGSYVQFQQLRLLHVPVALAKLRSYARPGAREAHAGEMLALRGYAEMRLAEDVCPGFPLHDMLDYKTITHPPVSTEEAFQRALAAFDSAMSSAADSVRILNFARVARARTLLNLARFSDAASAAADVPNGYVYQADYNAATTSTHNVLAMTRTGWATEDFSAGRYSVADREGSNGLDFVSAKDPRVKADSLGVARDGVTRLYGFSRYANAGAPIVLASGVEARLIEAEAALHGGGNWLGTLNALRTDGTQSPNGVWNPGGGGVAGLAPLTDPGTPAARVDLLFRERAFWLFATGHRLGDLRRLLRQYSRTSESVFPSGAYWRGGAYGTGVSLPFPAAQEAAASPDVTGCMGN